MLVMDTKESELATFAFTSRVFILVFQCVANILIPDHDAGVFSPPRDKSQFSWADDFIQFLLGGLRRWDAIYFTHIMQFGYTFLNCVAFFPFYPLVGSSISSLLHIFGTLHYSSWILLTSVLLNVILFVLTAIMLYRLGKLILPADIAFNGAMMFCFNPASIFMSAPYSEILYMFLLCLTLLKLHAGSVFMASFLIGLSVFTRSNGIVGIGFIIHSIVKSVIINFKTLFLARKDKFLTFVQDSLRLLLWTVVKTVICLVLSLAPFFVYQFYIYQKFCLPLIPSDSLPTDLITYGRSQGYHVLGDEPPSWCNDYLPLSYFYIQKHHWDVGFLRYYQIKQLPNFFLAAPVIILSFFSCRYFFLMNPRPFYTLGLIKLQELSTSKAKLTKQDSINFSYDHRLRERSNVRKDVITKDNYTNEDNIHRRDIISEEIVVYVFHLVGLTLFGCCFIHIQVITRLLCSSSPLLYWYCGAIYLQGNHKIRTNSKQDHSTGQNEMSKNWASANATLSTICLSVLTKLHLDFIADIVKMWSTLSFQFRAVFVYFITYCVVGTIMFCNFLPWT